MLGGLAYSAEKLAGILSVDFELVEIRHMIEKDEQGLFWKSISMGKSVEEEVVRRLQKGRGII
ncbi:hypothetical protein UB51_13420 [Paenibacillus sp. IHBB 10380]|nr:hypothetical protein UB51_13420 [Paenibacillus sp. IHBB 10380]